MDERDGNVAFKCTYNDGGPRGFVGFDGICSDENIIRNVSVKKQPCCRDKDNPCRQFCDKILLGRNRRPKRPVDPPCYERRIFKDWSFGAGAYHSEERYGEPIPMKSARVGKVALLTTRHPRDDSEEKRIVFGIFKISRIDDSHAGQTWVTGEPEHAIRVPEAAAQDLLYWNFKKRPRSREPKWGTGLFRYISDQEVTNFLHELFPRLQSPRDRAVLEHLLECCGNLEPENAVNDLDPENSAANLERKYGPGGEGEQHRSLKEHVAQHPEILGLGPGRSSLEHGFVTGDRVGISIVLDSGEHCVVEIEVEGRRSTLIGAHQALKYQALRTAELDDGTKPPHTYLVAYRIPSSTREFCDRHGVMALEIEPG